MTAPPSNLTFEAQPATNASRSGDRPSNTGDARRRVSIVSIGSVRCSDRGQLLGHVDADRAPGDAAPAADAAGRAELVVPGAELVRQPLAVARPARRPDAAAVDVGVVDRVAGVPDPRALGALAREVGRVLDGR